MDIATIKDGDLVLFTRYYTGAGVFRVEAVDHAQRLVEVVSHPDRGLSGWAHPKDLARLVRYDSCGCPVRDAPEVRGDAADTMTVHAAGCTAGGS